MIVSKKELNYLLDNLCDFLKTLDEAINCIEILLPKPKVDIGSTKSKDNLFAQYFNDTNGHPKRQFRFLFRFGNNNSCVFSIKKLELHGNDFVLTQIVNPNPREIHHLYKNRYYLAKRCEIIESNYEV